NERKKTMLVKKSLLREMLCGLLLGLLIMPAQPAQAQWTVFDPLAYSQRLKSDIKRILEWVEEISFYQQLYTTSVQQLTSLHGVLGIVDKQLAKDMETARLTSDIADIIRDSYQLHSKVKGMVGYQIQALQRIDDRLKSGILDPERDLQDF